MEALYIHLFGKLDVRQGNRPVMIGDNRKARELLCFLILHPGQAYTREMLAEMLWSQGDPEQLRKYIRQTLWQAQTLLDCPGAGKTLFVTDSQFIALNPKLALRIDALELMQAYDLLRRARDRQLTDSELKQLQDAVELYRGDLLEGWYQDWCLLERERHQHAYLDILNRLAVECEFSQHYEAGIVYADRILRYDRAHERTHRQLMRLYYLSGDRTAALRQFERCVTALKQELDVTPARATVELFNRICIDNLDHQAAPEKTSLSLKEVLTQLFELRGVVSELQRQMRHRLVNDVED